MPSTSPVSKPRPWPVPSTSWARASVPIPVATSKANDPAGEASTALPPTVRRLAAPGSTTAAPA